MEAQELNTPDENGDQRDAKETARKLAVRGGLFAKLALAQEQLEAAKLREGQGEQNLPENGHPHAKSDTEYWGERVEKLKNQLKI